MVAAMPTDRAIKLWCHPDKGKWAPLVGWVGIKWATADGIVHPAPAAPGPLAVGGEVMEVLPQSTMPPALRERCVDEPLSLGLLYRYVTNQLGPACTDTKQVVKVLTVDEILDGRVVVSWHCRGLEGPVLRREELELDWAQGLPQERFYEGQGHDGTGALRVRFEPPAGHVICPATLESGALVAATRVETIGEAVDGVELTVVSPGIGPLRVRTQRPLLPNTTQHIKLANRTLRLTVL